MIRSFHIVLSLVLVTISFSITCCHSPRPTQFESLQESWYNKSFVLPEGAHYYGRVDSAIFFASPKKIVTHIDGNCGSCLNRLNLWNNFLDSLNGFNDVNLFIYVSSYYPELIESIFLDKLNKNLPFLHDIDNQFVEQNTDLVNANIYTVLLDEKNCIILVGDPISNEDIMRLYLDSIGSIL